MRLFIACELPAELRETLTETSALLRDYLPGRYVAPDSFHITLAFLGEVPGTRIVELQDLLEDACAGYGPIPIKLGELGYFGKRGKAALWQGFAPDAGRDRLEELADSVRRHLSRAGFDFDGKSFLPHITLMRAADLTAGILPGPQDVAGSIARVSLFSSDLSGERPSYEALYTVELD